MDLPLPARLLLFGCLVGPLPVGAALQALLVLASSALPLAEHVRGGRPAFGSLRWFLTGTWPRCVLFGLAAPVADFLALVLAILGTLALQGVGAVKGVPLRYNVRSLMVRWRTSFLTALAFTLVVGLMTLMLAFVNGMEAVTRGSAIPGNVVVLSEGALDEAFSDLGFGDVATLADRDYVRKDATGGRLLSWELYQVVSQDIPDPKPGGRDRRMVPVRGVEEPLTAGQVHGLELRDGRWFDEGAGVEVVPGAGSEPCVQAVLGEGLARELGTDRGRPLAVGDTFDLGPREWVVVGVLASKVRTFDSEVWAKRKVVGEMLRKDTRTTAVFRVAEGFDPKEVAARLNTEFKSPALAAWAEPDYYDSLNSTNRTFLVAILGVAASMAVGGVFGVMNTMFAAVAQRTKDIGVLRIIGFGRWQVLTSFFLESVLLAVVGGLMGCALGSLCHGMSATSGLTPGKTVMLSLVVDGRVLGAVMAFALLMGCLGGLLPALSAVRLKMLDALR